MLDTRKPSNLLGSSEPSYRLYACQSHVTYSRPQCFDGKFPPPAVLTILARVVVELFIIGSELVTFL